MDTIYKHSKSQSESTQSLDLGEKIPHMNYLNVQGLSDLGTELMPEI